MAKVTIQVLGGEAKVVEGVSTVAEAMAKAGISGKYTASINGDAATLDSDVEDFEFITLSESVKGAAKKVVVRKGTSTSKKAKTVKAAVVKATKTTKAASTKTK